jgi:hypothetical protein
VSSCGISLYPLFCTGAFLILTTLDPKLILWVSTPKVWLNCSGLAVLSRFYRLMALGFLGTISYDLFICNFFPRANVTGIVVSLTFETLETLLAHEKVEPLP